MPSSGGWKWAFPPPKPYITVIHQSAGARNHHQPPNGLKFQRFPQHVHRHAMLGSGFQDQLGVAGAAFDFLTEVGTEFLKVGR